MNNQEKLPNSEKSEKQRRWDEIAERVNRTVDKTQHPIDAGIKEGVIALNAFDIHTTASCEGHIDHGTHSPWIDVGAKGMGELRKQLRETEEKGENEERLSEIRAEIKRKNLEERRKLFLHLDDFYKDRNVPFHQRLIVSGLALGWSRLESQGADLQRIEKEETRKQRLFEYQEEMRAFISFLKGKYFKGER